MSARHFTRASPVVSSTRTPSSTSMSSPGVSFRSVLLPFTAKAVVIAMSFTHLWNSCTISDSEAFGMPAARPPKVRSSWAAFRPEPGICSTNFLRAAAGTRPSFPPSWAKRSSAFRPFSSACARRAALTARMASPETSFLAAPSARTCFLHLDSSAPAFTLSLIRVERHSLKGPFAAVFTPSKCASALDLASATPAAAASRSATALSIALSGSASPAPLEATSASAGATAFVTASSQAATSAVTSSEIAVAAFLSPASRRFFCSSSMATRCFLSASPTCFLAASLALLTLRTRDLIFCRSALVSASGPDFTDFSSSVFCSRYLAASLQLSRHSLIALSTFRWHAVSAE
mmetsp:Transcript_66625/g.195473  ORF Transcript_66625/g.195473 Transcript_66625/m.195473 type:complete len:348 (+) Transcript_66625:796-1839(+)